MLVNNGTANAVLGTILSATPVITTLNTCTPNTILTANGGSCTFSLNANSTISGNTNTLIPYTDSQGTQYPNIMLNVTYITATPGPNQSITLGSSSTLTNTVIGTTSILPVTITNTGTVTLESITFYPSSQPSSIIYDPISSCKTNGTQSLVAGNSCTLILDYTPTSTENGVMLLSTMASYGSGQSLPTGPVSINYSSESGVAVLNITPNSTSLAIKADGVDTKTQVFTIINNGQIATTITAESIPVGLVKGADTCLNQTIAVGGSCTISTSFGPTRSTVNSTTNLTVTYLPIVGMAPVNAYSAVSLAATTSALIQITNVTESGIFTGSGNTFTFTNSPLTPFVINITYTNNGTSVANLFTIFGPLPYGWYVQSTPATTCQFNQGVTLSAGSSCILSLAAMDPTVTIYGISPYSYAGALNVNIPGFSYNDTSGTTRVANPSYTFGNTINVTSRLFANVSESSTTTSGSGSSAHVIAAKFTLAGSVPAGHFPITITTDIPTNGAINSAIPYCTIVSAGGDCTVTINTVAGAPTTTYTRSYTVSPNGSANGITGKFTFVVQ